MIRAAFRESEEHSLTLTARKMSKQSERAVSRLKKKEKVIDNQLSYTIEIDKQNESQEK
ncbi:MAG: hypothetical protein ACLVB1_10355 [Blautia obeum]